jgi:hypothetical protein
MTPSRQCDLVQQTYRASYAGYVDAIWLCHYGLHNRTTSGLCSRKAAEMLGGKP